MYTNIHITLTECTFVIGAPSSIQCLQTLLTIINLFIVESDNIFVAKDFYGAENIKQEIVRVSTLTLLRVPIADLVLTSVSDPDPDCIRIQEGKNDPQKNKMELLHILF
jgi:hypothetical protein